MKSTAARIAPLPVALLCLLSAVPAIHAQAPGVTLADTGLSSPKPLNSDELGRRQRWQPVPEGQKPSSFKGDAVVANGTIAVAARKGAAAIEVYSRGTNGWTRRAELTPVSEAGVAGAIEGIGAVENGADGVELEVAFKGGAKLRAAVGMGSRIVQTEPAAGAAAVRVRAPARFGVLPDFFADDMVVDARTIPPGRSEIPSENFFLLMQGEGEAIVATIWDKAEKDVEFAVGGDGESRSIEDVDIGYGKGGKVWIGVLEGTGIWHAEDLAADPSGKVVDLAWSPPFYAKWKANLMTDRGTGESFVFRYHPRRRNFWGVGLGQAEWPCWIDGKEKLTPHVKGKYYQRNPPSFVGPALVYPIDRSQNTDSEAEVTKATPDDQFTVVDLMRNSMGVGPCEFILDMAGQTSTNKGLYTCSQYDRFETLYKYGEPREERALISQTIRDTFVFVKAIRDRIEAYVVFQNQLLAYLAEQKAAHPEQTAFIGKMEDLTRVIQKRYDAKRRAISTLEEIKKVMDTYEAELLSDNPTRDWEQYAGWIRDSIGENGDDLSAECRLAVKVLRQAAALEAAKDPKVMDTASEIRKRSHEMLRNKLGHEASLRG